jgi:uncharacterized membrane protein
MYSILLLHLLIGLSLWPFAILFKLKPPPRINHWYGYRTKRSMKSQVSWDAANRYSSKVFIYIVAAINLFQLCTYFLFDGEMSLILSTAFMTIAVISMIPITERYLKNRFGS